MSIRTSSPDAIVLRGNAPVTLTLFLLHVFWWLLMNRIAWKMVRGKAPNEAGDEEYEITMADKATTTRKKE